nr:zinc finger protein 436-like [Salvelinus alpinus]
MNQETSVPSSLSLQPSSPLPLPVTPGRTSPGNTLLLGLKRLSVLLVDCRKTPELRGSPNRHSLSRRGLSTWEAKHHDAEEAEKSLSRSEHLKKHQQRPTRKKSHCCSDCGKSYTSKVNLRGHQENSYWRETSLLLPSVARSLCTGQCTRRTHADSPWRNRYQCVRMWAEI